MTFAQAQNAGYEITQKEYQRIIDDLLEGYADAFSEIQKKLEKMYLDILGDVDPSDYYNTMIKFNRLEKLAADIQGIYKKTALSAGKSQAAASRLAIANTYYRELFVANWGTPEEVFTALNSAVIETSVLGTEKVWTNISKAAQEKIEATFGSLINYQPQYGTLTSVLVGNSEEAQRAIKKTISSGLIQGKSFREMSRDLRKDFETTKNNALRVARTEGHRNQMAGNYAMTNAARADGVDIRRQIISVRDTRTRVQSQQVDREKEDNNGMFTYPGGVKVAIPGNSGNPAWDINDRESVLTNVNDISPELTRGRNPVTGKTEIISFTSFDSWLKDNDLKRNKSGQIVQR